MKHEDIWRALDTLAGREWVVGIRPCEALRARPDNVQSVQATDAGRTGALAKHREPRQGAERHWR